MADECCSTNNNHERSEQKVPCYSSKETVVDHTSPDNVVTSEPFSKQWETIRSFSSKATFNDAECTES